MDFPIFLRRKAWPREVTLLDGDLIATGWQRRWRSWDSNHSRVVLGSGLLTTSSYEAVSKCFISRQKKIPINNCCLRGCCSEWGTSGVRPCFFFFFNQISYIKIHLYEEWKNRGCGINNWYHENQGQLCLSGMPRWHIKVPRFSRMSCKVLQSWSWKGEESWSTQKHDKVLPISSSITLKSNRRVPGEILLLVNVSYSYGNIFKGGTGIRTKKEKRKKKENERKKRNMQT